jgi:hypothetical protein
MEPPAIMSLATARELLAAAYPNHSICIEVSQWIRTGTSNVGSRTKFTISVLPGVNGDECSQVSDDSLKAAVKSALLLNEKPPAATAEEMAEHFSEASE